MKLPSSSIFIIKQKKHTIMKHFWLSLLPLFWCIFINKQNTIENMSVIFFLHQQKEKKISFLLCHYQLIILDYHFLKNVNSVICFFLGEKIRTYSLIS